MRRILKKVPIRRNLLGLDPMTLPDERYRALERTEEFLISLCNPKRTPRVPKEIRDHARWLLRHYPTKYNLECLADASPDIIVKEMEPVHRFLAEGLQGSAEQE